ncbi:SCO4848 family membrane protein [Actinoplanes sp. NPDC049118]|uniref:SCO4848 family membrane protein n=1 Tax=Actinoplanes sp. NPDC049118 TaxID=3155769 RepID=UPI0033FE8751
MVLSRRWSAFLVAVGVWTWLIWPRFGVAIWKDDRSFAGGAPTSFLWVHALLIGASLLIGTTVGVLGVRAWRKAAPRPRNAGESAATGGPVPED